VAGAKRGTIGYSDPIGDKTGLAKRNGTGKLRGPQNYNEGREGEANQTGARR